MDTQAGADALRRKKEYIYVLLILNRNILNHEAKNCGLKTMDLLESMWVL